MTARRGATVLDPLALATHRALYPLYLACFDRTQLRARRRLAESERWDGERLRDAQWRSLAGLLRFAYDHNRFYRRRLDAERIAPEDVRSFADFARLPLLTKEDLRSHGAELVSEGLDATKLEWRRTGGSTGVPVQLYWDPRAARTKAALAARHDAWAGFLPGLRKAALWGDVQPPATLRDRLRAALHTRTLYLDTLEMDDGRLRRFVEELRRRGIRLLFGHGHSLYHLACFVRDHGLAGVHLDAIVSSAEMLPPEERRVVEKVFGEIVFDRYGCEEVGLVASECERHDGLHVAAEGVYVEILDDGARPGRVVVTDLLNRGTPLLRYEIGDLAVALDGACACGRGLPRIGRIAGRTSDVLRSPDGRQVSGISFLDTVTIHIPGFRQVQVVQEAADELTFRIVPTPSCSEASLRMLRDGVTRYFGAAMRHRVVFVDRIPLTGRGKFQYSVYAVAGEAPARGSPAPVLASR